MNNIVIAGSQKMTQTEGMLPAAKPASDTGRGDFLAQLSSLLSSIASEGGGEKPNGKNIPVDIKNIETATIDEDVENNSSLPEHTVPQPQISTGHVPDSQILTPELLSEILGGQTRTEAQTPAGHVPQRAVSLTDLQQILSVLAGNMPSEEKEKQIEDIKNSRYTAAAAGGVNSAPISSAVVFTENKTASPKETPTAEDYMANHEEVLRAAKDILAWISSRTYTEGEASGEEGGVRENAATVAPLSENEGQSVVFSDMHGKMMSVMPSKAGPSAAASAAEAPGTPVNTKEAVPEFAVKPQPDKKPAEVPVSNTARAADDAKPAAALKSPENSLLNDKTVPAGDKQAIVTEETPEGRQEKQFAQAEPREKRTSGENAGKGRDKAAFSFTLEKPGGGAAGLKEAPVKHQDTEGFARIEKEPADINARPEQAQKQPEAKQAEAVLKWESAKDAVNLAKMIQQAGQNGATKLTVRLNPEHLGRLEIQLTEVGGRIDAKIMANSQESRNLLASHGDAIRQQLAEKGIHIDNMNFSFHDAFARQDQGRQDQQSAHESRQGGRQQNGDGGNAGKDEASEPRKPEGLYA